MNIELSKFNMTKIKEDKVVVFLGKRETGKSFLVKDLLYYHQDIPVGTIISGTEGANGYYSKMVPSIFIHGEYKEEVVVNYIKRQKIVIREMKHEMERRGYGHLTPREYFDRGLSTIDPRAFLILDDCLYDDSWTKNKQVRALFMNGRHYFNFFIITLQYALGIPPRLRTNVDYVFILRENITRNRKQIYEQYAGMFPTYEMFSQVMDQCTENFECIVIDNNSKSNKIEDQVYWYKAETHDNFKLGHPSFWEYHVDNFDPDFEREDEEFDPTQIKKKKGPLINVKKV